MKVFYRRFNQTLLVLLLGTLSITAKSQKELDSVAQQMAADSIRTEKFKEQLRDRINKDSISYESDTIVSLLLKKIEDITELINAASGLSERGLDTINIVQNLPGTERLLDIIAANYVSSQPNQNLRSLKTTRGIINQAQQELESWQEILFEHSDQLADMKVKLATASKDSVLRRFPKDSLLQDLYLGQIASLAIRWKQTDSLNNRNLFAIGILQNRVASAYMKSKDLASSTNDKINKYIQDLWVAEEPSLFKLTPKSYSESFFEVLHNSWKAFGNMLFYYFFLNVKVWITALLGMAGLYGWLLWLKRKIIKFHKSSEEISRNAKLVSEKPFLVAVGIVLVLIVFVYFDLPPAWTTTIWCVVAIIFHLLNRSRANKNNSFRVEFLVLFFVINGLVLLLKSSFAERWLFLLLNIYMIAFGLMMLKSINEKIVYYRPFAKPIYICSTFLSVGALIANIAGNFTLSKIFDNGAVYSVITAHVLFITADILIQLIYMQQEAYKENKLASYFDFFNIQQTMSKSLKMAARFGWLVVMAQQLNFYDYAYEMIATFLTKDRSLGANTFTFGSILVFLLVIWVSSFISKLIFVFFGDHKVGNKRKSKWGSYLILFRLGVLSAGILIAFAASGIPMDKLTIIIGALGVGIGFGLQNIVNNLVSGVILAFEKPVQVGDAIEVGNRYGVVKEIGIRSSKLVTIEGSEVIVPNGDMLSQHIVNWTLSSHYRRVELIVGVSYSTDLRKAESILQEIISTQKGVEKHPEPSVLAHKFGESAIDFRLLFWCDIDEWVDVKSEVLIKVHQSLTENGIKIPFPQRDINIRDMDKLLTDENKNEKQKNKTEG